VDVKNVIGGTKTETYELNKSTMSSNTLTVGASDWQATITTTTSVNGDCYYMTTNCDPRIGYRCTVGDFFNLSIGPNILASLENIEVTNTYDENDLPDGVSEDTLGLYHWDADKDRFMECDNYIVDTISNTITGLFPSNGTYAVMPRYDEIIIQKGWNLISYYYSPQDPTLATLLDEYGGNIDFLYRWNADLKEYEYAQFINGKWKGDFSALDNIHGYWLHANDQPTGFKIYGDRLSIDDLAIKEGWNLISWPKEYEMTLSEALEGQIEIDFIYMWNPVERKYDYAQYINGKWKGDLTCFEPGVGCWMHSSADTVWSLP